MSALARACLKERINAYRHERFISQRNRRAASALNLFLSIVRAKQIHSVGRAWKNFDETILCPALCFARSFDCDALDVFSTQSDIDGIQ